jgi:YVTN family beta-propeller protein
MRKLALLSALLLVPLVVASIALSAGSRALDGAVGTVWVTERTPDSSSVTAFDAATGDVLGTTSVGSTPIGITQPRGVPNKVYSSDEAANQMSVIDRRTVTVIDTIPTGPRPHHLMANRNGSYIYVGEFGHNQIGVIDTSTDTRVEGYAASQNPDAKTHAVWIARNNRDLYATNEVANSISKLDAQTGDLIWEFPIGNRPSEILVTQNGKTAYVTVRNENRVKVVDVSGVFPAIVGETIVGTQPDTMQLTNDEQTLVVGLRSVPQMAFVDTNTLAVQPVTIPGHGISGHQWLSANSRFTFIALESPGSLAVIDNETRTLVRDHPYPTGLPRPHGVFYEPQVLR